MKRCFKCGLEKTLSEFYKHPGMADGHLNKCKDCAKKDVKERRKANPHVREYDRKRGNRQSGEYFKRYRKRYPKKYHAHTWVNNAVRDGRIYKPDKCENCSSNFAIEGHHDDYNKPEEVRWLCSLCHSRWHRENGEALNPL